MTVIGIDLGTTNSWVSPSWMARTKSYRER